jgi:putative transport protein
MEAIGAFFNTQPFIALFLVIGLGYAVGKINVGGFSLGIGAVLFVGIAVGAIAPKSAPPGLLGLVGLVLFLYGIGIQYGREFFRGLASPFGIKANILAVFAVLAGWGAALLMTRFMDISNLFGAGMFAGSMTSTASLQAAIEAAGNKKPAVGYDPEDHRGPGDGCPGLQRCSARMMRMYASTNRLRGDLNDDSRPYNR